MKNCYKRLPLEGAYNLRDLGGYPASGGKMTQYHVFYRSDCLHRLSEADWSLLQQMGIKTIIDLRSSDEQEMQPYYCEPYGITRYSIPLKAESKTTQKIGEFLKGSDLATNEEFLNSLFTSYPDTIEQNPDRVVLVLRTISENVGRGGVLYHCTAGKDRTGIISSLLLYLAGVADGDIIADYQVTQTYITRSNNEIFQHVPEQFLSSAPKAMEHLLTYYRQANIKQKLLENGLKAEEITTILDAFLH